MSDKNIKQPDTAFASPRFVNTGNFMRMDRRDSAEGLDFAIYGVPFDTASSYRTGARFGPQGIRNISVMMKTNHPIHEVNILDYLKGADLGDVNVVPGYILPTYDAIEEGLIDPHKSIQIGMRGSIYDEGEFKLAKELGLRLIPTHKVREMGIPAVIEEIKEGVGDNKAFLSIDIDFFDPAYAPGTGTPEVGGYTSLEGLTFVRGLTDINFVGMDLVEVAPTYDVAEITSLLAANVVFEFLSILALQRKNKAQNGKSE